jgi:hypothetical protein
MGSRLAVRSGATPASTAGQPEETTMADYHTSEPEEPEVYHDNDDCPSGKQIKSEHRVTGRGTGRSHCQRC